MNEQGQTNTKTDTKHATTGDSAVLHSSMSECMNMHDRDRTTFGAWLKRQRQSFGITQADLAHTIGCSIHLVRKVEANHRRPSKQMVERIADCIGVAPSDRVAFLRFARSTPVVALPEAAPFAHIPLADTSKSVELDATATSPLIGRDIELAELHRHLRRRGVRLVTMVGPPGIGKTRLAAELAAEVSDTFADGVYVAALASLSHSHLVPEVLVHLLGLAAGSQDVNVERVVEVLHEKHVLLVLDNFEHVIEAKTVVDTLLTHCRRLKVLVTSQVPLHLPHEHIYSLPALALPGTDSSSRIASIARYGAVALFVARAQVVNPRFRLTEQNVGAVVAICRRLDGLPLAIELIAARIKLLPPRALLTRLEGAYEDAPLHLLATQDGGTDPRHQTLRRAIAWSYELLSQVEKSVLARLAVFVGGAMLSAAEVVCSDRAISSDRFSPEPAGTLAQAEVLDIVASLLDKSLLGLERPGEDEPRVRLLETIRAYGIERLRASGQADQIHARHAEFYLLQAEAAERHLQGQQQGEWLALLEREHPNLRAALRWLIQNDRLEQAARMCIALWRFWWERDHVREGLQWVEQVRAIENLPVSVRAKLLYGAGVLWYASGDLARSMPMLKDSLVLFQALNDRPNVANVLNYVAAVCHAEGRFAQARDLYQQSLDIRRTLLDWWNVAISLNNLGALAHAQGDLDEAQRLCEESIAVWQKTGDQRSVVYPKIILGLVALDRGEFRRAGQQFQDSLRLLRHDGSKASTADCLEGLAAAAAQGERYDWAARTLGAAQHLRKEIGVPLTPAEEQLYERRLAVIRAELGQRKFETASLEGRSMTLEQAVNYALAGSFEEG